MVTTPRASIIAAPALVTFQGQTLFAKEDIKIITTTETFDVKTSGRPTMKRENNVKVEITFTPNGVWAPVAALIQAYAAMLIGTDIFGAVDSPIVIQSMDGLTYTYSAGALTKIPDVILSGGKTLFGPMTLTAIGANNTAPTTAAYRLAIAQAAYPNPDGYNPSLIITQGYSFSWGAAAPWVGIDTDDGTTISFALSTAPKRADGAGLIGMRYTDMAVTAKCKPLGAVASADVLAAANIQGAGAGRGRDLGASGQTLTVVGPGVYAELHSASLDVNGYTFSGTNNRIDELTFRANTELANNALTPLFYLGAAAPPAGE